jgi:putative endopeptidase
MHHRMKRTATLGFVLAMAASQIPPWGFDLNGMDRSVKPGDDFYRYAGGAWVRNNPVPPDRTSWGPFYMLRAQAETEVNEVVRELAARSNPPGSIEQKIADYYTSYLDADAIEKAGLGPVRNELADIAAARTHEDVARIMGHAELGVKGPVNVSIWPDAKHPDHYTVNLFQSGLGMPGRDGYLGTDPRSAEIRGKYRNYIAAMLTRAGDADAPRSAGAVLTLETEIASRWWPREKLSDSEAAYNPKSRRELEAFAPEFPWHDFLQAAELSQQDHFMVKQPEPLRALAKLFRRTSVEEWRAYMTFHLLNATADILPAAFDELSFQFNGHTMSGQPTPRPRWKRAISAVNSALGEGIGEIYVRRHFTPEAKAQITTLTENLRAAFRIRITKVAWMSPETRQAALQKLARFRVKVGYPNRFRDYSTLVVRANDPVGNRRRAVSWDWRRQVARLGGPTDRDEWGMTPQTVNAYYNSFFNEIVFPAAILQAPYFDPKADPAVNYGGIGGVIGHEMSHAFDNEGSKSDENGVLRTWWKPEDIANFKALTTDLAVQYSKYEPLPGSHLNGNLTLSENIGDNAGLSVALTAYQLSLRGKKPPVRDGFTGEQRFFLSWAQTYRGNVREEQLRVDLASDPHSPVEYRVNGVVRNMDAWYEAFGVKTGDKLYLPPKDRVRIW